MKSKISKKFTAVIMLSAFATLNIAPVSMALDGYGVTGRPVLRSADISPLNVSSERINNADSIVNLSLRDADVKQVLRMFADQAGMNIIFSSSVDGNVTMDLVDITLEKALNLVIATTGLACNINANTLIISNKSDDFIAVEKDIALIPVKYVSPVPLATFLNKNIFSKDGMHPGISSKPVVTVNSATNELIVMGSKADAEVARTVVEKFDKKPTITTFKVNHTTPAEMASLVCDALLPSVSSDGGSSGGGSTGYAASIPGVPTGFASDDDDSSSSSSSGGGGSSSGITVGGGTLACSVSSSGGDSDLASLDMKNLSVVYFPTVGTVQIIGGSQGQLEMIREYIAENDKKTPQAYLEVQIISLSEAGSKTFDNTWTFMSKNFSFNAGGNSSFRTPNEYPIFFAGHGFTQTSTDDTGSSTSTNLGKWSSSPTLVYQVNYLVENNKGRVLANPRILITSGQESTIDLTSDYVSKVTTEYLDNSAAVGSSQVQRTYDISDDNGIKISITPFISPDGYVTLDISPEYNTIGSQITMKNVQTGEREIQATLLQRRELELKGIRIKDGETLVIGGMISENENKSVTKIPFLGDIPVLGMFFRSTATRREKEEMVIMITPQIIVENDDTINSDLTL